MKERFQWLRTGLGLATWFLITTSATGQNWQTYTYKFKGEIAGNKVQGEIVNRFGALNAAYQADSAGFEGNKVTYLAGVQDGPRIILKLAGSDFEPLKDGATLVGSLQDSILSGVWKGKGISSDSLFRIVLHRGQDQMYQQPTNINSFIPFEGKDIWSCGFFSNKAVQQELARVMKRNLVSYLDWLKQPLARTTFVEHRPGLLAAYIWDDSNPIERRTTICLDTKSKRVYVMWTGDPFRATEGIVAYGDPIPAGFLEEEKKLLERRWGESYHIILEGRGIRFEKKRNTE